ncbi:MAG: type II toxin-antitoxin system mRNA interferase toxin, RelE/StbE family [Candidatus Kapabacteria bacterium]|nr:type II toxin-antitoxin system mRNA interferase toxin, RelE/StbE family [Candidatus Kapabacteria bacterium]
MFEFQWHNSFRKAFKKLSINNDLKVRIIQTLELLQINPFDRRLKTHKLHGELKNLYACSIDFDYRIVFSFSKTESNTIILVDIGTHNEVY